MEETGWETQERSGGFALHVQLHDAARTHRSGCMGSRDFNGWQELFVCFQRHDGFIRVPQRELSKPTAKAAPEITSKDSMQRRI